MIEELKGEFKKVPHYFPVYYPEDVEASIYLFQLKNPNFKLKEIVVQMVPK